MYKKIFDTNLQPTICGKAIVPGVMEDLVAKSKRGGGLYCEYGTPLIRNLSTPKEKLQRFSTIDIEHVCLKISELDFTDGVLTGKIEPTGPMANAVNLESVRFHPRSLLDLRLNKLVRLLTFDVVDSCDTEPE